MYIVLQYIEYYFILLYFKKEEIIQNYFINKNDKIKKVTFEHSSINEGSMENIVSDK